ncbi:putative porin [Paraburkholderia sp. BL23I1N1]|uniref:porin n=1 Tax=Paraburkholderia sp. BL23I1N1 TaxID=1938802 RepID=UPI000E761473|nr:porin [Paraburkholderia sp. BL23I1N1]RKE36433.1 putative porin [Paraburkholderia sp. BL23I1N1]
MKISKMKLATSAIFVAMASTSHAQSSVTLYGIAGAAIQFSSKTVNASGGNAGKTFAVADAGNGPSLFGIQGVEDLGSGMKAEFKIESGINMTNGGFNSSNGNFFGRQAWVGLEGNFGMVKAGLQFSPFFTALYASDPRQHSEFGSGLVLYGDNVAVTGAFNSNAVSYTSPKLAGFQGQAMLALGGKAGDFSAGRQWSTSLKYENASLMINAAFYDGNSGGTVQTPVPTTVAFEGRTVGAAYTFGPLIVKASFVNYKVAHSFNANVYGGGAKYQITPFVDVNGGVWYTSDRNDTSNHSVLAAVGTDYYASKRTSLYAQVAVVNNHGAMNTGLAVNNVSFIREVSGTSVGGNIGIRHSF